MTNALMSRRPLIAALIAASAMLAGACSDDGTLPKLGGSSETGTVLVKLTDAPFPTDQVQSVDIWVLRVDGRVSDVSDADADQDLDNNGSSGWRTLATPNASFNLLGLQNGATATLGSAPLGVGSYSGLRLIIDASKSSVTLKDGKTKLTGSSNPGISFPSATRSGLKINLSKPLVVVGGATTTLVVDFDVGNSFVMRGNTIQQNGLLFKPVINGSVIDAATVNANIRLANATASALDFVQGTTALAGGSNLAFGTSSACASVNAATPNLSVASSGTTTPLAFSPALQAGTSYTVVAYPNGANTAFVTLNNTFTPTTGQAGLRVFNASGLAGALDVFVTTNGTLVTPTVSNVLNTGTSAFVSVPAAPDQIQVTATGQLLGLLPAALAQTLAAGQNYTLVIAPPSSGTTPRAFLVTGC